MHTIRLGFDLNSRRFDMTKCHKVFFIKCDAKNDKTIFIEVSSINKFINIFLLYSIRYDTIRYDTVYLTCIKKLTDSQLSLQHGTNKNVKEKKLKNKLMSVISPAQSHYHEGSPVSKEETLRWEGFVEKVGFEPGVKE